MSTVRRVVGPAVAEWQEDEPLRWTLSEDIGKGTRVERKTFSFDLTPLIHGYGRDFLFALKECWVESCLRIRLLSIASNAGAIQAVLQACHDRSTAISVARAEAPPVFDRIDSNLLKGLSAMQGSVSTGYLTKFRSLYKMHRHNSDLFQAGLRYRDFPTGKQTEEHSGSETTGKPTKNPGLGELRKNVLATALSRATLVHILNITEAAYEAGELNLGLFAYSRLLLSRAARPESFRVLRLKDLRIDEIDGKTTYYLTITIPKARTAERPRATVRLHPDVGKILDRQRDAVAERLRVLIDEKNAARSQNDLEYPSAICRCSPL